MRHSVETLSNATLLVREDGRPVLATDPWLTGTCYFGSWGLDLPPTPAQVAAVTSADHVWISHGHPDHLHPESLALFPRGARALVPDHYDGEIAASLRAAGFDVRVLRYREWARLSPGVRVMCLDNMNQDGVLLVEADGSLLVNLNDSPLSGEGPFLRRMVRRYPRERTYLFALCAVNADMINVVDAAGAPLAGPPEARKRGMIWHVARRAERLGVGSFCCSSSQHAYVRADSAWANAYRIGWDDMRRHWNRPAVRLVEPYVTLDLPTGAVTRNHPSQASPGAPAAAGGTGADDWSERLSPDEWSAVERFMRRFELLRRHLDDVAFTVGGESRRIALNPDRRAGAGGSPDPRRRGIEFVVPRRSLLEAVAHGYFDDLLIGNFMRTRLVNARLYPRFTPLVAKLGGNAKVFTGAERRAFLWRYLRRNPAGTLRALAEVELGQAVLPRLRDAAERLGVKRPLKWAYRRLLGDPAA